MGTFDDMQIGEVFNSPTRAIDQATIEAIVGTGGYTHPIFTDPEFVARTPLGRTPMPGQGVLLLMGGLAEQTDRFDGTTIALVGLDDVRFPKPVYAGDEIHLEIETIGKEPSKTTGVIVMHWTCKGSDGDVRCETVARMLFRTV